jgi:hypothetical protein
MSEFFLQTRAAEIASERLREAAHRRLVRQASTPKPTWSLVARLLGRPVQPSDASAAATRRTPSSISDPVTAP